MVKATGHEIFNWLWPARRIVRIGNGRTVLTAVKVLLPDTGSGLSLAMETLSIIVPNALGTTVNVTITGAPFVIFPSAPVIGLLLVERTPRVVAADFNRDGRADLAVLNNDALAAFAWKPCDAGRVRHEAYCLAIAIHLLE